MDRQGESTPASNRVLTLPNAISFARILAIPVFCALIVDPDTTALGIVVFGVVVATDWIDGTIARRTGQVTELGKVLDPVADRAAIAAGVISLVVRGAFPAWAAALVLVRDLTLLVSGAVLLGRGVRIDVRRIGKAATFTLMIAIPAIAWGTIGSWPSDVALVVGWIAYAAGIVQYYAAAVAYARDVRRALG
ncbi:MAG TPA: CDP-alcohol phosphatidyltransferase family protein [Actinomycetota bacterium]